MSMIEEAIRTALEAHSGQTDRSGEPYIMHPIRIMCGMQTTSEKLVAILHDVVEDSDLTLDDLRKKGFPEEVVQAVDCLTKRPDESYESLIERARKNALARRVKIADLEDNMNVRRLGSVTSSSVERLSRYHRAWFDLVQAD